MPLDTPSWWYDKPGLTSTLLKPVGTLYSSVTRVRFAIKTPYRADIPVICVGNFTAGGAGKTPTALAVANLLDKLGERPVFLTRGYGGQIIGPHVVDLEKDKARDVGDEPLLLARHHKVVVASDRAAGARTITQYSDASVIVMDDGFQNPGLYKDLSLVVVDGVGGIGNGNIIPAGPLRAALKFQLAMADAMIIPGVGSKAEATRTKLAGSGKKIFSAELKPAGDIEWLKGQKVIAFAGIAQPEKFYKTLETLGADIIERISFKDHHIFSHDEGASLLEKASLGEAEIITTRKDWVRFAAEGGLFDWLKKEVAVLDVELDIADQTSLEKLLKSALADHKKG